MAKSVGAEIKLTWRLAWSHKLETFSGDYITNCFPFLFVSFISSEMRTASSFVRMHFFEPEIEICSLVARLWGEEDGGREEKTLSQLALVLCFKITIFLIGGALPEMWMFDFAVCRVRERNGRKKIKTIWHHSFTLCLLTFMSLLFHEMRGEDNRLEVISRALLLYALVNLRKKTFGFYWHVIASLFFDGLRRRGKTFWVKLKCGGLFEESVCS